MTIIELAKNKGLEDYKHLEAIALKSGYESIEEWALVNDRVETMFNHAVNIAGFPMPYGRNSGITSDTDIFAYINDETQPEDIRKRISDSFAGVCDEHCVEPSDLESVGRWCPDLLLAYKITWVIN